jgi:hypothetical protein
MSGRVLVAALGGAAVLIRMLATAQAHDWITGLCNRDAFLCCGSKDCTPIDPAKVTPRSGGYYLQSYKETVPYSEVLPSQDRLYWRCSWASLNVSSSSTNLEGVVGCSMTWLRPVSLTNKPDGNAASGAQVERQHHMWAHRCLGW